MARKKVGVDDTLMKALMVQAALGIKGNVKTRDDYAPFQELLEIDGITVKRTVEKGKEGAMWNPIDKELYVPFGDDPHDTFQRLHEQGHALMTPHQPLTELAEQYGLTPNVVNAFEDCRIDSRLRQIPGVDAIMEQVELTFDWENASQLVDEIERMAPDQELQEMHLGISDRQVTSACMSAAVVGRVGLDEDEEAALRSFMGRSFKKKGHVDAFVELVAAAPTKTFDEHMTAVAEWFEMIMEDQAVKQGGGGGSGDGDGDGDGEGQPDEGEDGDEAEGKDGKGARALMSNPAILDKGGRSTGAGARLTSDFSIEIGEGGSRDVQWKRPEGYQSAPPATQRKSQKKWEATKRRVGRMLSPTTRFQAGAAAGLKKSPATLEQWMKWASANAPMMTKDGREIRASSWSYGQPVRLAGSKMKHDPNKDIPPTPCPWDWGVEKEAAEQWCGITVDVDDPNDPDVIASLETLNEPNEIKEPPRVRPLDKLSTRRPTRKGRPDRVGLMGANVVRSRIDQRPFLRKRRTKALTLTGSVLIDCSGSMNPSWDEIDGILEVAPFSVIAGYSGSHGGEQHIVILAKDGYRVSEEDLHLCGVYGGNSNDHHGLAWLAEQPEPRIWVSDFGVEQHIACYHIARKNRIRRFFSVAHLLRPVR